MKKKRLLILFLFIVSGMAVGLYAWSIRGKSSSSNSNQTQSANLNSEANIENIQWEDKSIEIEARYYGKNEITKSLINISLPNKWIMQQINLRKGEGIGGADCYDYVIDDPDGRISLSIKPTCGSYSAVYSSWPSDVVVIEKQEGVTRTGGDRYILRFFDQEKNVYQYTTALLSPQDDPNYEETTSDTVSVNSKTHEIRGMFAFVELNYLGVEFQLEDYLEICDSIIKSMKVVE